jgi:hypothetical protein
MSDPALEDDGELDHPDDILGDEPPLSEEDSDMFVLFAEALDPSNDKTVDQVKAEWEELFNAGA